MQPYEDAPPIILYHTDPMDILAHKPRYVHFIPCQFKVLLNRSVIDNAVETTVTTSILAHTLALAPDDPETANQDNPAKTLQSCQTRRANTGT